MSPGVLRPELAILVFELLVLAAEPMRQQYLIAEQEPITEGLRVGAVEELNPDFLGHDAYSTTGKPDVAHDRSRQDHTPRRAVSGS
jgi:hypothetical protein